MTRLKSLGEVVCEIRALVNLMHYIEDRSASIYVRDFVNGELGTYSLSELPAPRALHWAFEFLQHCTIPVPLWLLMDPDHEVPKDSDSVLEEKDDL